MIRIEWENSWTGPRITGVPLKTDGITLVQYLICRRTSTYELSVNGKLLGFAGTTRGAKLKAQSHWKKLANAIVSDLSK